MFDDLFEVFNDHKSSGHHHGHGHRRYSPEDSRNGHVQYQENESRDDHRYYRSGLNPEMILAKVLQHKQLLVVLVIAVVVVLIGIVAVLFMLLPVLLKLLAIVENNGVKGLLDSALPLLNTLWEGKEALSGK